VGWAASRRQDLQDERIDSVAIDREKEKSDESKVFEKVIHPAFLVVGSKRGLGKHTVETG
jgi:hypothetical protein